MTPEQYQEVLADVLLSVAREDFATRYPDQEVKWVTTPAMRREAWRGARAVWKALEREGAL